MLAGITVINIKLIFINRVWEYIKLSYNKHSYARLFGQVKACNVLHTSANTHTFHVRMCACICIFYFI